MHIKFAPGDKIEVPTNSARGTITKVDLNSKPEINVWIKWDYFHSEYAYPLSQVINLWEVIESVASTKCQHTPKVYQGLKEKFNYCTKCNQKL